MCRHSLCLKHEFVTLTTTNLVCAHSGQLEYCQWLVANNASISAKDSTERTPYDIAEV